MDFKTANLKISDEVAELMEERGAKESDVREILDYAESTGKKLYVEGEEHFLARKRIGKFSGYVEYLLTDDGAELLDVYSHMVRFEDEKE